MYIIYRLSYWLTFLLKVKLMSNKHLGHLKAGCHWLITCLLSSDWLSTFVLGGVFRCSPLIRQDVQSLSQYA